MKKTLIALSLLSVVTLSACGTQDPAPTKPAKPEAAESTTIDSTVAALLPRGAFVITGALNNLKGPVTTINGYVKYGTDPDGKDCEADYTLTDVRAEASTSESATKQRSVRSAGATSWHQDISNPAKPGEWLDNADPNSRPITLLFAPNLITDDFGFGPVDGAGTGELCAIPMMARIMQLTNEELVYSTERAAATVNARLDRWLEGYIDAVGVTGADRQKAIDVLAKVGRPSFGNIMDRSVIKVTMNDDGSYEIAQLIKENGRVLISLLFTPTAERVIEPVSGKPHFEKVTEEVENSGLTPLEFLLREQDNE